MPAHIHLTFNLLFWNTVYRMEQKFTDKDTA